LKRDLAALEARRFDVLVVGGGIYGACIARDAAKRGLATALIERADFGAATSHNSFKLIHGGLRYLQQLDIERLRQSAAEQRRWLGMAPHLLQPLAFVMPTVGHLTRGPEALRAALWAYELLARHGEPRTPRVPAGRVVGRAAALGLFGDGAPAAMNGAAIWYDVQMRNADRLLLEIVADAAACGAVVANHVEASGFLGKDPTQAVEGVSARDRLTGLPLAISARLTINAAGPHAQYLLDALPRPTSHGFGGLSRGLNLVVRRPLVADQALAISSRRRSDSLVPRADGRLFFIQPWQGLSLIGTSHLVHEGSPDGFSFDEAWLDDYLAEVNDAYPPAGLTRDDVLYGYAGLTPAAKEPRGSEVQRTRRGVMVDHQETDGLAGLLSLQGVKYTTARLVAEHVTDLAASKLDAAVAACRTWQDALPGARGFDAATAQAAAAGRAPEGSAERDRLVADHGSGWGAVMALALGTSPGPEALFAARVRHAVRHEMAMRLDDVLVRRLDEIATGRLDEARLAIAARITAAELGWTTAETSRAVDALRALVRHHCPAGLPGTPASTKEPADHAS
jgi:glycerol-3-phosphate dehydrogenase